MGLDRAPDFDTTDFGPDQSVPKNAKSALELAADAVMRVQKRTKSIQEEMQRIQAAQRRRKDMFDREYHDPIFENDFSTQIAVSPNGQLFLPPENIHHDNSSYQE